MNQAKTFKRMYLMQGNIDFNDAFKYKPHWAQVLKLIDQVGLTTNNIKGFIV